MYKVKLIIFSLLLTLVASGYALSQPNTYGMTERQINDYYGVLYQDHLNEQYSYSSTSGTYNGDLLIELGTVALGALALGLFIEYMNDYNQRDSEKCLEGDCYNEESLKAITKNGITYIYKGGFNLGSYDGYGEFYFKRGNKLVPIYLGNFENGQYSGTGTLYEYTIENDVVFFFFNVSNARRTGKYYIGENLAGKKNGLGTYYNSDGQPIYKGYWKNNRYDGSGITFHNNGETEYIGDWKNGQKKGSGKLFYENGQLFYDGYFANNQPSSSNITTYYKSGDRQFKGDLYNGVNSGRGTYFFKNGNKFYGVWSYYYPNNTFLRKYARGKITKKGKKIALPFRYIEAGGG